MRHKGGWNVVLIAAMFGALSQAIYAQTDPNGGILPFSTHVSGQYDTFDPSSGNVMLTIPVVHKAGKIPFAFDLIANVHAFVHPSAGVWWLSNAFGTFTLKGIPSGGLGQANLTYSTTSYDCNNSNTNNQTTASNFVVTDATGAPHAIVAYTVDYGACGVVSTPATGLTGDGSGYSVVAIPNGANTTFVIYDRSGNQVSGSVNATAGSLKDPDGVQMLSSYQYNGNGMATSTYTDTLGQTVLIATSAVNRSVAGGGPSSPDIYTYFDASGTQRSVQVNYTMYPQRTNFGCSLIPDYNFGTAYFPTSIVLPDGETFLLSYEPTFGYSGSITGRLAKLTLPTGGYVAYSYSGSSGQGMNCNSQKSTVTRTVNDGQGNTSQWTYVPAGLGNYTVTETDPALNTITYHFYSFQGRPAVLTEKTVADSHGNVLSTMITCYNGNNTSQASCISPTNTLVYITQTDVYTSLGSGTPSLVETVYDYNPYTVGTIGNALIVKRWNVGTYPPSGSPVSTTTNTFANISGVTCGNALQYILDHPCTSTTTNSSGVTVAQTKYTYNSGGHPTQTQNWVGGPTFLTTSASYNPNGTIATSTDANGQITSYAYNGPGGCNNLLPTSTTAIVNGVTLTTSQTWNCFGAAVTSTKDANSQATQYSYLDQNGVPDLLWRLRSITDPLGNVTVNTYSPTATPPTGESSMLFNNGQSIVDHLTTYDGLGRPILQQTRQAPGSTTFDTVMISYDLLGRVAATSLPCASAASTPCASPLYTTTTYDALNRPLQVADAGGGYTQYTYTPSGSVLDTLVTVGPNPSGENLKKRQLESDSLGRLTSVCEITGAAGSGSCAQGVAATGYRTAYVNDALDRLTSVTQNAQGSPTQTRTFVYDGLSRLMSETNPESGTKTYTYVGPAGFSDNCYPSNVGETGDLHQVTDANGNYTCFIYDGLHRLTDVGNNNQSATNPCKRFRYDSSSGVLGSFPTGVSEPYPLGRLVEAETDNCTLPFSSANLITDEWSSYNQRGDLTDSWQSSPHSGGYYHVSAGYFANGAVQALNNIGNGYNYGFGVDGEGRPYSAALTNSTLTHYVNSVAYNPASQPLTVSFSSGDSDAYTFDPNTGRMSTYTFTVGSTPKSMVGTLTWNANGTLSKLAVNDAFNASGTQTCKYGDPSASIAGYDDLSRLVSANCGSIWSQSFSYDPFGNLTKSGTSAWMPGYNQSNNRYTLGGTTYDADGNLLTDTFHSYTWNVYGRPATIDGTTTLTYDANDVLIEKGVSGAYTEYQYGPTGKTCTMNGTAQVQCITPLPGGSSIARGPETIWHPDWLGSPRLGSSPINRTITFDRAFAPFGEQYDTVAGGTTNLAFTGLTQDSVSGEYDTPNRLLHPGQGRWISPDPAGLSAADPSNPQSWNRYAYVMNNPLALTDPSGLWCVDGIGADGSPVQMGAPDDPSMLDSETCTRAGDFQQSELDSAFQSAMVALDQQNSIFAGENSINWPLGTGSLGGDIWNALGLPSGLSCPQVGGVSNFLCGGVSPMMDGMGNVDGYTPCNVPHPSDPCFEGITQKDHEIISKELGCIFHKMTWDVFKAGVGGAMWAIVRNAWKHPGQEITKKALGPLAGEMGAEAGAGAAGGALAGAWFGAYECAAEEDAGIK